MIKVEYKGCRICFSFCSVSLNNKKNGQCEFRRGERLRGRQTWILFLNLLLVLCGILGNGLSSPSFSFLFCREGFVMKTN